MFGGYRYSCARDEILEKFLESETKYAEISKEGVKTVSLASALKARILAS
jgi:hypothetical protein